MYQEIKNFIKTYAKKLLGVLLILVGIVGLFLPFLQGIFMISAGIILLGNKKLLDKMRQFFNYLKDLKNRIFTRKK